MARAKEGEETVSSYFRRVFKEKPLWLKTRSNDLVLQRWLDDHPGEKEVPKRVKQGLMNVKSVLRHRRRKRRGKAAEDQTAEAAPAVPKKTSRGLEHLEEQIDECLTMARSMDREALKPIIHHLRQARNAVVWKMG
jgi:hypothetical protein